jgi:hypothetical protein
MTKVILPSKLTLIAFDAIWRYQAVVKSSNQIDHQPVIIMAVLSDISQVAVWKQGYTGTRYHHLTSRNLRIWSAVPTIKWLAPSTLNSPTPIIKR